MNQISFTLNFAHADYQSGIETSEPESLFDASTSDSNLQELLHELL